MGSDYEFDDDDGEYYDSDEDMIDGSQDGRTVTKLFVVPSLTLVTQSNPKMNTWRLSYHFRPSVNYTRLTMNL